MLQNSQTSQSEGVQLVGMGATLGMAFGPIGAAVGGVIGGILCIFICSHGNFFGQILKQTNAQNEKRNPPNDHCLSFSISMIKKMECKENKKIN